MSLTFHYHPLSSFCQKALIGLYELGVPFDKLVVDLGNEGERAALSKLWPMGRFPLLRDEARAVNVPETSIILAYVEAHYGKGISLLPRDPERALDCQLRDRFFDLDVNTPMQKIVTDKLRPEGKHDPFGVERAQAQLEAAYGVADDWLRAGPWAAGETFSVADCAAAPALFYANQVQPFTGARRHLAAYFARLSARPSFARVLAEAKPYWSMFPG
jgi:glutathione S-transferase